MSRPAKALAKAVSHASVVGASSSSAPIDLKMTRFFSGEAAQE